MVNSGVVSPQRQPLGYAFGHAPKGQTTNINMRESTYNNKQREESFFEALPKIHAESVEVCAGHSAHQALD